MHLDRFTTNLYDITNFAVRGAAVAKRTKRLAARDLFRDASLPLLISRHNLSEKLIADHRHEFTELVIVLGGQGRHVTGGRTYRIGAGDVFVILGERSHAYRDMKALELINCLFQPEVLLPHEDLLRRAPGYRALFVLEPRYRVRHGFKSRLRLGADALGEATRLIARIERELETAASGHEAMAISLLQELVIHLSREYSRERRGLRRSLVRLAEVIEYLETHYAEKVALGDLAERAHMSVNNFLRVFKDATGDSPVSRQIRVRVMKGAEFMTQRGMSITEAAYAVGFCDGNYFSRQFSKVMGASPRAYLRQQADRQSE